MRPAMDYAASRRLRLTRRQFWGTVVLTVGYIATALVCGAFVHHLNHAWSFAIRVGLVTSIVTGVGATVNPYIEYYADYSASGSSFAVLLCNPSSIGWHYLMYA